MGIMAEVSDLNESQIKSFLALIQNNGAKKPMLLGIKETSKVNFTIFGMIYYLKY